MSKVEKVTVSLPAELLARIEDRRRGRETSRSEVVSELLWRGWRLAEAEDREQRYRASYHSEPDTREEQGWADQAASDMPGEENSVWGTDDVGHHASS
ncbi:MAG: ribbon-helix-helix domain-containing protein [Candidatus Dormibacteria bacterium]